MIKNENISLVLSYHMDLVCELGLSQFLYTKVLQFYVSNISSENFPRHERYNLMSDTSECCNYVIF